MDNLSKILKEAKPIYFARKRRNNRIKASLSVFLCVGMLSLFYPQSKNATSFEYSLYSTSFDEQVYLTETGSVIEDMGLPIDDFGLLMV
ncbi:MAG: hypothetical protein PHE89_02550 [Alphaproteobacteria bacterium]|nr:hypothetical protein [Alphaproteobacteria bacterium]